MQMATTATKSDLSGLAWCANNADRILSYHAAGEFYLIVAPSVDIVELHTNDEEEWLATWNEKRPSMQRELFQVYTPWIVVGLM